MRKGGNGDRSVKSTFTSQLIYQHLGAGGASGSYIETCILLSARDNYVLNSIHYNFTDDSTTVIIKYKKSGSTYKEIDPLITLTAYNGEDALNTSKPDEHTYGVAGLEKTPTATFTNCVKSDFIKYGLCLSKGSNGGHPGENGFSSSYTSSGAGCNML